MGIYFNINLKPMKFQITLCVIAICLFNFSICDIASHIDELKKMNSKMAHLNSEIAFMAKNGSSARRMKVVTKKLKKMANIKLPSLNVAAPLIPVAIRRLQAPVAKKSGCNITKNGRCGKGFGTVCSKGLPDCS